MRCLKCHSKILFPPPKKIYFFLKCMQMFTPCAENDVVNHHLVLNEMVAAKLPDCVSRVRTGRAESAEWRSFTAPC